MPKYVKWGLKQTQPKVQTGLQWQKVPHPQTGLQWQKVPHLQTGLQWQAQKFIKGDPGGWGDKSYDQGGCPSGWTMSNGHCVSAHQQSAPGCKPGEVRDEWGCHYCPPPNVWSHGQCFAGSNTPVCPQNMLALQGGKWRCLKGGYALPSGYDSPGTFGPSQSKGPCPHSERRYGPAPSYTPYCNLGPGYAMSGLGDPTSWSTGALVGKAIGGAFFGAIGGLIYAGVTDAPTGKSVGIGAGAVALLALVKALAVPPGA
jgi:hypothetical protein